MSKMLFRRAAATGAAFVMLGFAAAMSLSPVASAATIRPAASQTVHAPQILRHPGHWCHRFWHPWCDDEDWGGGGGNGWSGGGGGSSDCADGKGGNQGFGVLTL